MIKKLALATAAVMGGLILTMPASARAVTAEVRDGVIVVTGGEGSDSVAVGLRKTEEGSYAHAVMGYNGDTVTPGDGCRGFELGPPHPRRAGTEGPHAYCPLEAEAIRIRMGGELDVVETSDSANLEGPPVASIWIKGGNGKDYLAAATDGAAVTIKGGLGNDQISGREHPSAFSFTAHGGGGRDALYGRCTGEDNLFGDNGSDGLLGQDGNEDLLDGGRGDDGADFDRGLDVLKSLERELSRDVCSGPRAFRGPFALVISEG